MDLKEFDTPFTDADLEWRIQQSGKAKSGKVWALVVPYVTNRAIMDRLDAVCGKQNWKNAFYPGPAGGVMCEISIRIGDEWIPKADGADNTNIEEVKGGFSNAMKRAAVQWGMGRHLYTLEATFANVHDGGKNRAKLKDGTRFRWDPPSIDAAKPEPEVKEEPEEKSMALRLWEQAVKSEWTKEDFGKLLAEFGYYPTEEKKASELVMEEDFQEIYDCLSSDGEFAVAIISEKRAKDRHHDIESDPIPTDDMPEPIEEPF